MQADRRFVQQRDRRQAGTLEQSDQPEEAQGAFRELVHVQRAREVTILPSHGEGSGGNRRKIQPHESWKSHSQRSFDVIEPVAVGLSQRVQTGDEILAILPRQARRLHPLRQPYGRERLDVQRMVIGR